MSSISQAIFTDARSKWNSWRSCVTSGMSRRWTRSSSRCIWMPPRRGANWTMADYKHTINLPDTKFPMKADLAQREPATLKRWEDEGIYQKLRKVAKGRPRFVLHD